MARVFRIAGMSENDGQGGAAADVLAWHARLGRSSRTSPASLSRPASIARFAEVHRRISQPALDQHVLAIHLGGPKRVIRTQPYRRLDIEAAENSITVMPAFEAFEWETFGPIDFAHMVIGRADLAQIASEEFDRDPADLRLEPVIGVRNDTIASLMRSAIVEPHLPQAGRLRRDATVALLSRDLLERHASTRTPTRQAGCIATWQLRRVLDYMHEHLAEDMALANLVALTSVGRARFFDLFRSAMGQTPCAYLLRLRLLQARELLVGTKLPIMEVAASVGLEPTRFSEAFRRLHGVTPREFRASRTAR